MWLSYRIIRILECRTIPNRCNLQLYWGTRRLLGKLHGSAPWQRDLRGGLRKPGRRTSAHAIPRKPAGRTRNGAASCQILRLTFAHRFSQERCAGSHFPNASCAAQPSDAACRGALAARRGCRRTSLPPLRPAAPISSLLRSPIINSAMYGNSQIT